MIQFMPVSFFFNNWEGIVRAIAVGVPAYIAIILLLRISGKRTLSKLNVFDLVVTVALGSTLASTIVSKDTALAEGITALAVLIFLQFVIAWLSARSRRISRLVKAEPRLLFYQGEFLEDAMLDERITEGEIKQAVRSSGIVSLKNVEAVVIETNGDLSVMPISKNEHASSLYGVRESDLLTED